MDLFGFKRRKAERECNARLRAEALERATRVAQERPSPPPRTSTRERIARRHPEYGPSDGGLGSIYPHGSAFGMGADSGPGSSRSESASSSHDSLGPAGSGAFGHSDSGGYTNTGSGYSNYDSGGSGGGYSSSDSGGGFSSSD
jgi:hypothetical protein